MGCEEGQLRGSSRERESGTGRRESGAGRAPREVQRTDFARRDFVAVFRGRPPSLPFARALSGLRRAPIKAATPTISTLFFCVAENRAARTCARDRVSGW